MAEKYSIPIPKNVVRAIHTSSRKVEILPPEVSRGTVKKWTPTPYLAYELDGMRIDEVALLVLAPGAEILYHTHEEGQYEAYFKFVSEMDMELDGALTKPGEGHSLRNDTEELLIRLAIKYRML